jgi:hypothetical protein
VPVLLLSKPLLTRNSRSQLFHVSGVFLASSCPPVNTITLLKNSFLQLQGFQSITFFIPATDWACIRFQHQHVWEVYVPVPSITSSVCAIGRCCRLSLQLHNGHVSDMIIFYLRFIQEWNLIFQVHRAFLRVRKPRRTSRYEWRRRKNDNARTWYDEGLHIWDFGFSRRLKFTISIFWGTETCK